MECVPLPVTQDGSAIAAASASRCLYDDLFSTDEGEARDSIDRAFSKFYEFGLRTYGMFMSDADIGRLKMMAERGNHGLKLAFMLFVMTHETAIRKNVNKAAIATLMDAGTALDSGMGLETVCKTVGFYRVLSIAVRSIFETPFTEVLAPVLVDRFIQFAYICWKCTDSEAMQNLCDSFSSRKRVPGTPRFAHWARDAAWDGSGVARQSTAYGLVDDPSELGKLCLPPKRQGSESVSGGRDAVDRVEADGRRADRDETSGADWISARLGSMFGPSSNYGFE
jgi:hypothetical protein